jgi:hypothetical protein
MQMPNSVWKIPFCGGEKVFGESSANCSMTGPWSTNCRCAIPQKRNYELCYSLLVGINQEKLHKYSRYRKLNYIIIYPYTWYKNILDTSSQSL